MKNVKSRVIAVLLAAVMALSFSGCSAAIDGMIDFLKNGWDGVYEEKERAEYIAPDPTVRTHEIRVNYRVTKVNNVVTDKHRVTTVNHEVGSKSNSNVGIAATDAP